MAIRPEDVPPLEYRSALIDSAISFWEIYIDQKLRNRHFQIWWGDLPAMRTPLRQHELDSVQHNLKLLYEKAGWTVGINRYGDNPSFTFQSPQK